MNQKLCCIDSSTKVGLYYMPFLNLPINKKLQSAFVRLVWGRCSKFSFYTSKNVCICLEKVCEITYIFHYITKSNVENNSNDNIPKSENSLIVYQIMRLVCTVIRSHNITLKIYITPLSEDFGD